MSKFDLKQQRLFGTSLDLVQEASSQLKPHTFRCNHCQQTFDRPFHKVLQGQHGCRTPSCSNYFGKKVPTTFDALFRKLTRSEAKLLTSEFEYEGQTTYVAFECACGEVVTTQASVILKSKGRQQCKACFALSRTGERNPNWNPDRDQVLRQRDRQFKAKDGWATQVFELHNYTCILTGIRGGRLSAHHLDSWGAYPDRREDVHNGVAISPDLHREFHNQPGHHHSCTAEQFAEFYFSKTGHLFSEVYDLSLRRWKSGGSNLQTN